MKKLLLLLILTTAVGGVWWLLNCSPMGSSEPEVVKSLPAEGSIIVTGLEDPLPLIQKFYEIAKSFPDFPQESLDPEKRKAKLGFDPLTEEGWRSVGLDIKAGLSLVGNPFSLEAGVPLMLFKVLDKEKALKLLRTKTGEEAKLSDERKQSALLSLGEEQLLLGQMGPYTLLFPLLNPDQLPKQRKEFEAFLSQSGPRLSEAPLFRKALEGRAGTFFGFLDIDALVKLLLKREAINSEFEADFKFYSQRFPGLGLQRSGLRILASQEGLSALRKMFVPPKKAPSFSKHIPARGWAALRFSVNIKQFFTGLGELYPPSQEISKGNFLLGSNLLPMMLGVSYAELASAFSGHAVLALRLPKDLKGGAPRVEDTLLMLGLGAPKKSAQLLDSLLERTGPQLSGLQAQEFELVGYKGKQFSLEGQQFYLLLGEEILYASLSKELLKLALENREPLNAQAAEAMDGAHFLAEVVDIAAVETLLKATGGAPDLSQFWKESHFVLSAQIDTEGIFLEAQGGDLEVGALFGALSAVAIPAFLKYERRTKEAEAQGLKPQPPTLQPEKLKPEE